MEGLSARAERLGKEACVCVTLSAPAHRHTCALAWVIAADAPLAASTAFTPAASAAWQSVLPWAAVVRRLWAARWAATRELEQAVFVGTQGPALHADEQGCVLKGCQAAETSLHC